MVGIDKTSALQLSSAVGQEGRVSQLNAAYTLAAEIISADDEIKEIEVQHAKALGVELFPGFDDAEFMRQLNLSSGLQQFEDAVLELSASLNVDGKDAVYNYLREIAMADDILADEEEELLAYVRQQWGLQHLL